MKLSAVRSELAALRGCCVKNKAVGGTLLAGLDEDFFHYDFTRETYKTILRHIRKHGDTPKWRDLVDEPNLPEEVRKKLKNETSDRIATIQEAKSTLSVLNEYRQMRGMFELSDDVVKTLKKSSVKVADLIERQSARLVQLRQTKSNENSIITFGVGNNAGKIVKALIDKSQKPNFVPTGFSDYDKENGGIFVGSLFTIGATSGGGKSATASQLAINWAGMGERVCIVPLEMTREEMTARVMANAAGLDVRKILLQKLSREEEAKYLKRYRKTALRWKKAGGSYSIYKPEQDQTIEEIMASVYTLDPSIVIVDYISLLKGVDGDDAWQKLGAVARYCKVYAETHKKIVVLLCQVSEEGKIRYAQAIKEHCLAPGNFVNVDGRLVSIEDAVSNFVDGSFISTTNQDRKILRAYTFKEKETIKLTTRYGYSVETSSTTPVLVLTPEFQFSWVKAKDVRKKDVLVVGKSMSWPKTEVSINTPEYKFQNNGTCKRYVLPTKLNRSLAKVLGYLSAEGATSKEGHFQFAGQETDIAQDYAKALSQSFGRTVFPVWNKHARCSYTGYYSKEVYAYLKHIGATGTSRTKRVPWPVMQGTKESAAEFLRAYFEGDGCSVDGKVTATTYSEKLARDIQLLLLKFGIVTQLYAKQDRKRHLPSRTSKAQGVHYELVMTGLSHKKYMEQIGFVSSRKTNKAHGVMSMTEGVPFLPGLLRSRKSSRNQYNTAKGIQRLRLQTDLGCKATNAVYPERLSKEKILDVAWTLKEYFPDLADAFLPAMSGKMFFDPVVSIKQGYSKVYDFTVQSTESPVFGEGHFIGNGIATHNSNNCWVFVSTKQTRENEIINVEQLKARNGRLFDFTLSAKLDVMRIGDLDVEEKERYIKAKEEKRNKKSKDRDKGEKGDKGDKKKSHKSNAADYLSDMADEDDE